MTRIVFAAGTGTMTSEIAAYSRSMQILHSMGDQHARGAPQASVNADAFPPRSIRLRILLSFHYYKDTNLDDLLETKFAPHYPEIFIDSGGFSAMTQGAVIEIDDYIAYIKRFKARIATYANLNVIGDAAATLTNQQIMEAAGLAPLPVFHTGEDWSVLEAYIERYPYIALGGMVPYLRQWKKLMPWLIRCFKLAEGKSVFHGFGATSWGVISALPWYSVDSSSWAAGFRFGQIALFDAEHGKWYEAQLGDQKSCRAASSLFAEYGYDWRDFAVRVRNQRAKIAAVSALAYIKAEGWLRRRFGEITIPGRALTSGIHLVDRDPQHLRWPSEGAQVYLAAGDRGDAQHIGPAPRGLAIHLADAQLDGQAKDAAHAAHGLRIHLADTSQAEGHKAFDTASAPRSLGGPAIFQATAGLGGGGIYDSAAASAALHEGDS